MGEIEKLSDHSIKKMIFFHTPLSCIVLFSVQCRSHRDRPTRDRVDLMINDLVLRDLSFTLLIVELSFHLVFNSLDQQKLGTYLSLLLKVMN